MKKLIEALQYMLKFIENPEEPHVVCEHDIMRMMLYTAMKSIHSHGFLNQ